MSTMYPEMDTQKPTVKIYASKKEAKKTVGLEENRIGDSYYQQFQVHFLSRLFVVSDILIM